LKVLFDYQIFSLQVYGGVSRYFVELAKQLSCRGDTEIKILAPYYINNHLRELDPGLVSGRHLRSAPTGISKVLDVANRLASRRAAKCFAADILHRTYFAAGSSGRGLTGRTVLTVYDMIHERLPEEFPSADRTAAVKQRAVAEADHVICISDKTRDDLLDICDIDASKVTTVHIGFKAPEIDGGSDQRLVDGPYLLYVGLRDKYKNFSRLLEAYVRTPALHRDYSLVCFGGRQPDKTETEPLRTAGLPVERLVWMRGDDALLARLYRGASAFVYPSLYEGFGIPPLEAMAQGCPVICSTGGSIPEIVGDAGEFFDPVDPDALAAAIVRVVSSEARAADLRQAGRIRIRNFSWEKCAKQTRAVYASLL
jgi:glycosyltransferase involved in cell wall biosynthesis